MRAIAAVTVVGRLVANCSFQWRSNIPHSLLNDCKWATSVRRDACTRRTSKRAEAVKWGGPGSLDNPRVTLRCAPADL